MADANTTKPDPYVLANELSVARFELKQKTREVECLRALVTRLTSVAADLASAMPDPCTEALAAIHCGRNFIYG